MRVRKAMFRSPVASALVLCLCVASCRPGTPAPGEKPGHPKPVKLTPEEAKYAEQRAYMVRTQIEARGVRDPLVLSAMRKVPRRKFMPAQVRGLAYHDGAVPIGHGQTISQPFIVAAMTEQLQLRGPEKVLEIGTGTGYQAAVLAEISSEVCTIEILKPLADTAAKHLKEMGYKNVRVRCGDGFQGWKEHAPFDAIIVTCAPPKVPQPLIDQLKVGGRLVCPVGKQWRPQKLVLVTKTKDGVKEEFLMGVAFVPMTGEAQCLR